MTDRTQFDIDAALDQLAEEVHAGTPAPGADLVARVLADAAAVAAVRPAETPAAAPPRERVRVRWVEVLFGWRSGAVAAMALALVLGIGVGMQVDVLGAPGPDAEISDGDGDFFTADSGSLFDEFL